MAEDDKGSKKEESQKPEKGNHGWWSHYVDRIVMGVLGFMCVWFFTTMWELSKKVESLQTKIEDLQSKKDVDKAQWRTLQGVNDEIGNAKTASEVNGTIIKYYVLPLLLKNRQGAIDIQKVEKADIDKKEEEKKSLGKKIIDFVISKEEEKPLPKKKPEISEEEKKKIEESKKLLKKIEESKKKKSLNQYIEQQMEQQTIEKVK